MKVINVKNETCQAKDPIKRWKKHNNTHLKKLHPLKLITCKNTKIQGIKTVRNSEQITKNLLYVMLMNLEFFSAIFLLIVLEKKVISKYQKTFLQLFL